MSSQIPEKTVHEEVPDEDNQCEKEKDAILETSSNHEIAAVTLAHKEDSTKRSVCSNDRKTSTDNESVHDNFKVQTNEMQVDDSKEDESDGFAEMAVTKNSENKEAKSDENFVPEAEDCTPEDDPDFYYKSPRKQKFEYNKRKDVILKTILRKCRRTLQDEFNNLTGYFPKRKIHGHQFLKDSILKYHDSFSNKPEQLDLIFYLGAVLYPQEMSRGVDCFFESDKNERVKFRKIYRAKIQKVHDVLYRYSHEKMDYFVTVPELAYLYSVFYQAESKKSGEDIFYMNGATEIFIRCQETLTAAGICV